MLYGLENFKEMHPPKKGHRKKLPKAGGKFDNVKAEADYTMVEVEKNPRDEIFEPISQPHQKARRVTNRMLHIRP